MQIKIYSEKLSPSVFNKININTSAKRYRKNYN